MRILHLTLKKKWFDMIASGEKKEEYREMKLFWLNRFFKPQYHVNPEDYYPEEFVQELIKFPNENLDTTISFFGAKRVRFDLVTFANGYSKTSPKITVEFKGIEIGKPISGLCKEGWLDTNVFKIKLGNIISSTTPANEINSVSDSGGG